jgi:hypothetical protein
MLDLIKAKRFPPQLATDPTDGRLQTIAMAAQKIYFETTGHFESGSGAYVAQFVDLIADFTRESFERVLRRGAITLLRLKRMLHSRVALRLGDVH